MTPLSPLFDFAGILPPNGVLNGMYLGIAGESISKGNVVFLSGIVKNWQGQWNVEKYVSLGDYVFGDRVWVAKDGYITLPYTEPVLYLNWELDELARNLIPRPPIGLTQIVFRKVTDGIYEILLTGGRDG